MNDILTRMRALEDARAVRDRYHRRCLYLGLGFFCGLVGFIGCGVFLWFGIDPDPLWFLGVPTVVITAGSAAAFICTVTAPQVPRCHPDDAVRRAQYALDDARDEDARRTLSPDVDIKVARMRLPEEDLS